MKRIVRVNVETIYDDGTLDEVKVDAGSNDHLVVSHGLPRGPQGDVMGEYVIISKGGARDE